MCVFQIDIERAPLRPMNSINEFQVKAAFNTLSDPSPSRRFPRQSNSSLDLHPPPLPRSIVRPIFHDIAGSIHPASAIVYVTEQIIDYRSERRDSNVKGTFHSCTRGNTTCSPVEITGRTSARNLFRAHPRVDHSSSSFFLPIGQLSEI